MIEQILTRKNLLKARRQVEKNRGSSGVDGMPVGQLKNYLDQTRESLLTSILNHGYVAQPILGVVIPKGEGKTRLLGVPTVIDRMLKQAASQVVAPKFELEFKDHNYGFRPKKNAHQAVLQSQKYINEGYQHIVDIDLKNFFDETVRRCGGALYHTPIDLPQGEVPHYTAPDQALVTSSDANWR